MAQETTKQQLVKRVQADIDGGLHASELMLAQIADNKSLYTSSDKFKFTRPTSDVAGENAAGGGPTGAGITVGGYNETAGAYQDDTYTFARAIST